MLLLLNLFLYFLLWWSLALQNLTHHDVSAWFNFRSYFIIIRLNFIVLLWHHAKCICIFIKSLNLWKLWHVSSFFIIARWVKGFESFWNFWSWRSCWQSTRTFLSFYICLFATEEILWCSGLNLIFRIKRAFLLDLLVQRALCNIGVTSYINNKG